MKSLSEKKFRYCVLYVQGMEQQKFKRMIEENLFEKKSEVIIPRMEIYKRGKKKVDEICIFPGYVFIYTDLNMKEIHELLKCSQTERDFAFKELALRERRMDNPNFLYEDKKNDGMYGLSDLNNEETEFLDMLRQGNGLLSMSCGYEEDGTYHVMEGPLKVYEDKIQKVDKHNRKAFLKFEIHGMQARAGFECKPKSYWFPEEESQIALLSDGTEVDLEELKRKLTTKS